MVEQSERGVPITSAEELEGIVGTPLPAAANKSRTRLHDVDRAWLAAAPLAFVATSDEYGALDELDAYYGPRYAEGIYG